MGLLRDMEKAATAVARPPRPPPSRSRPRPSAAAAAGSASGASPATAAAAAAQQAQRAAEAEELRAATARAEGQLGAETMLIVRKLRTLQRRGGEMDESLVVNKTRKYVDTIGARIADVAAEGSVERAALWAFVSRYTENSMSGSKLESMYMKVHTQQAQQEEEQLAEQGAEPPAQIQQQP